MDTLYPPGPAEVPKDLTRATPAYRRQAWLATVGLLAFVALYFGLAAWFVATAWRLFAGIRSNEGVILRIVGGGGALFLATFMLKAVFFVKRGRAGDDVEVTPAEQPALFAFLYQLADDARAPRPYRVVVSGRVNAAVFYDLSLVNLFFRSRKNLEIGLGLVNVLSLGEIKAVLAHEFGHFAQRSMAVGRWVYVAQQIAGHLVTRRDALDGVLLAMSTVDLRVAWVGWVLRLIVWSIRSLVDMVFRGVIVAQRALSREMEFQADLVAVSLTGSDALIEALHRLLGADDAWDRSLEFAEAEFKAGHPVRDLFAVQTRVIERMRVVLADPTYASVPARPATGHASYRLFETALAAPPRMWATHPPNADREANAKRKYVAAAVDGRPAWSLFANPEALREQVSTHMVRTAEFKAVTLEESIARLDAEYSRLHLDPAYRGAYLGRSATRYAERMEDLYAPAPAVPVLEALDTLYPESLAGDLERLRALRTERSLLEAVRAGFLKAPGGVIRRQGEEIALRDLPLVMDAVQRDFTKVNTSVQDHDRRCRSIHLVAAQHLGEDWVAYLKGVLGVLHYADHAMADLMDAHGLLSNSVAIVTADGKVSADEAVRLLQAAQEAYAALRRVHDRAAQVLLDPALLEKLEATSWAGSLEELKLPEPTEANLGPWLNAVSGWTQAAAVRLNALQLAALDQLLATERRVGQCIREAADPGPAPEPSVVPANYQILLPGQERERQTKLGWWDRFQLAEGWIPAVARAAVAVAIVGAVLLAGSYKGDGTIAVYNGLGRPVTVKIGETLVTVEPFWHRLVNVPQAKSYRVRTATSEGAVIEEFDAATTRDVAAHVYNVAGAGALAEWRATNGSVEPRPLSRLQNARWSPTRADGLFSFSSSSGNGSRTQTVLAGLSGETPERVLAWVDSGGVRTAMIEAHIRWDATDTKWLSTWMGLAEKLPEFRSILAQRLRDAPRDVVLLRVEQDAAVGGARRAVCERHQQLATQTPDDPNLQYVAGRCLTDGAERRRRLQSLHERWPNHPWLKMAAGQVAAEEGRWTDAVELLNGARGSLPGVAEMLVVQIARIRRILGADQPVDLADLVAQSEWLEFLNALETGKGIETGPLKAYPALAHGDLQEALIAARATPGSEPDPRVVRLVAASDGASDDLRERALALPPEAGLDRDTVWPALALAVRERRDPEPYVRVIQEQMQEDAPEMLRAFELLQEHASPSDVDRAIVGLNPYQRGLVASAAVVLWGAGCPPRWRVEARKLLFASERPYFKS